ncbi:hypothetical protein AC792_01225 [Arthrobacter sp. RIT-PI-e]|nr:hypothetical protein AC792_01225 [Arthrobacter sp. RIT-PI-e]
MTIVIQCGEDDCCDQGCCGRDPNTTDQEGAPLTLTFNLTSPADTAIIGGVGVGVVVFWIRAVLHRVMNKSVDSFRRKWWYRAGGILIA